jgi:hypothetical protein
VAPGARQPVGGFSALLKAPWRDGYLGMPDNGFGSKANSHSFLLRVYAVKPHRGDVEIQGAINLRDPNHRIPFELVNEATERRYLTGGDFDIESFRIDPPRHAVVRRRIRPVPPPHRRHREGAREADPAPRRALAGPSARSSTS